MLPTFVIGLREGLEAALIVGIIAAFLKKNGSPGDLRKVWIGVGAAVAICIAGGLALQAFSASLPQRQQEMLECVIAAIAVVIVSYMILWMRRHSRGLKHELEGSAGDALSRGSAWALVAMAFLAVLREGFETAVFLLAAFQAAISPTAAVTGAALGIAVAALLGLLIYRGGIRLNLSRFFRYTGVALVLVAAGLVAASLRGAYEAGWLTIGQQTPLDLSGWVRPGSVQASLITGVLGIRAEPALIEILAYLLYLVPMMLVVLWPPKRQLTTQGLGKLLTGAAAGALVLAAVFALTAPSAPGTSAGDQGPLELAGTVPGSTAQAELTRNETGARLHLSVASGGMTIDGETALTEVGHIEVNGHQALQLRGEPVTGPAVGDLPATLTGAELAAENGGRLPIGLRAADAETPMPATHSDTWRPTVAIDPASGVIVALEVRAVRTVQVTTSAGLTVSGGTVAESELALSESAVAGQLVAVAAASEDAVAHEVRGQVIPALLAVFALVGLAFGLPKLLRRRPEPAPPTQPRRPDRTPVTTSSVAD